MKIYHRTQREAADEILAEGFRDNTGSYMVEGHSFTGVWLSNVPLDCNAGAWGEVLLQVTLDLSEPELADYEWIEEGKPYREWLVPAALINTRGRVEEVTSEDDTFMEPPQQSDHE